MKKLLALLILIIIPAITALAAVPYSADLVVTNNSSVSYTMLSANVSANVSLMVTNGFITSTGLDTRVQSSGSDVPWMLATDRITFAVPVPSNSTNTYQFVTAQTAASSMDIVLGHGGIIGTPDSANLEPSNNFSQTVSAYLPTANYSIGDFSTYTEVDFSNNLTVPNGMRINACNVSAVQDYYLSKDLGAGSVNAIDVSFEIFTNASVASGRFGIGYTNNINDTTGLAATDLWVQSNTNPSPQIQIVIGRGNDVASTSSILLSGSTTYYVRLFRAASSDTATAYIYADAAHTVSAGSITLAGLGAATTYRYSMVLNTNSGVAGRLWTGYIQNTTPTYINKDGAYNVYPSSNAINVQIMSAPTSAYTTLTKAFTGNSKVTFTITQNSTTLGIQEGTGAWTTTSPKAVPNTTSNWTFLQNIPYANSINMSGGGTTVLSYQPIAIIASSTIPDRSTDGTVNNGAITWGGNPLGVSVLFGSLTSTQILSANYTSSEFTGNFMPGNVTAPQSPTLAQANLAVQTDPLYNFVEPFATISSTPAVFFYWFGTIVFAIVCFILGYRTKHLLIAAIAFDVPFGYGIVKDYIPEWAIILLVIWTIGAVVQESRM